MYQPVAAAVIPALVIPKCQIAGHYCILFPQPIIILHAIRFHPAPLSLVAPIHHAVVAHANTACQICAPTTCQSSRLLPDRTKSALKADPLLYCFTCAKSVVRLSGIPAYSLFSQFGGLAYIRCPPEFSVLPLNHTHYYSACQQLFYPVLHYYYAAVSSRSMALKAYANPIVYGRRNQRYNYGLRLTQPGGLLVAKDAKRWHKRTTKNRRLRYGGVVV